MQGDGCTRERKKGRIRRDDSRVMTDVMYSVGLLRLLLCPTRVNVAAISTRKVFDYKPFHTMVNQSHTRSAAYHHLQLIKLTKRYDMMKSFSHKRSTSTLRKS
jgi:hypothetical protein